MKKSLLTLCVVSLTFAANAQLVPNGGFETPITGGVLPEWQALSGALSTTTSISVNTSSGTQTLVSASGPRFALLANNAQIGVMRTEKFALSSRPASLRALVCYFPAAANEVFGVRILMTKKNGANIDTVFNSGFNSNTGTIFPWASFSVDLSSLYKTVDTPDSAIVLFITSAGGTPTNGSALVLDDVKFSENASSITGVENHFSEAVNVYPNPATTTAAATVAYQLNSTSNVDMNLYDLQGRLVQNIYTGTQVYGTYSHAVNTIGMAPGIYFLKVKANDQVETKRIVISE